MNKLSQWSTKAPSKVLEWPQQVLKYLKGSKELAIFYGRPVHKLGQYQQLQHPKHPRVLEIYADSWEGDLVAWDAGRQPFTALSSAEAELIGMLHGVTIAESTHPLFEEFQECDLKFRLLGDNMAACRAFEEDPYNWRSRHLRIRAAAGRERVTSGLWTVKHLPGQYQLADLATKPLPGNRLSWLLSLMNVVPYPSDDPVSTAAVRAPGANPVGTGKNEKSDMVQGLGATNVGADRVEGCVSPSSPSRVSRVGQVQSTATLTGPKAAELMQVQKENESRTGVLLTHPGSGLGHGAEQDRVKMALVAIILASLCCPTMSSREIAFMDTARNSTSRWSLQETWWAVMFFILVVIVWETAKWAGKKILCGGRDNWCMCRRRKQRALLEADHFPE